MQDHQLPECTDQEVWAKATTYAAMKVGRKSAVRVLDTEQEALAIVTSGKATHIEIRNGAHTRCERYCAAAPVCNQWAAWKRIHGPSIQEMAFPELDLVVGFPEPD